MDETTVRRIQEEHKSGTTDALRNAKLINISAAGIGLMSKIEDVLRDYYRGQYNDADEALVAVRDELSSAKEDLRTGLILIEKLFGIPDKGSVQELNDLLHSRFGTESWEKINVSLYTGPGRSSAGEETQVHGPLLDVPTRKKPAPIQKGVYNEKAVNELMNSLDEMIGLQKIKQQLQKIINLTRMNMDREKAGKKHTSITNHMVFTGNPGTGKTTVARKIGQIFKEMGLLSIGHFTEVTRADLVGEYIGSSEKNTTRVLEDAMGGVLFIDEAYSLAPDGEKDKRDYGARVIEVLIQAMENHRDDLIVIAAGYTKEMQSFLSSNPGLSSRFSNTIHFDDYSSEELYRICRYMIDQEEYSTTEETDAFLNKLTKEMYAHRAKDFGNAREIRNLVDDLITAHANRVAPILDQLSEEEKDRISIEDCAEIEKHPKYAVYLAV